MHDLTPSLHPAQSAVRAIACAARHADPAISASASPAIRPVLLSLSRFPGEPAVLVPGLECLAALCELAARCDAAKADLDDLCEAVLGELVELVAPSEATMRQSADSVKVRPAGEKERGHAACLRGRAPGAKGSSLLLKEDIGKYRCG